MKYLNRIEILEFAKKYFPNYLRDIRTVAYFDYNNKLNNKVKKQENQIDELKTENNLLQELVERLRMRFERLIQMIKDKFLTKNKKNIMSLLMIYLEKILLVEILMEN